MPTFIEIGGVTRKPLVDLTWNDPHTPTLYSRSSHINEQCFCYNYDLVVLGQAIIFLVHDISRFEFQDGCHKRLILR